MEVLGAGSWRVEKLGSTRSLGVSFVSTWPDPVIQAQRLDYLYTSLPERKAVIHTGRWVLIYAVLTTCSTRLESAPNAPYGSQLILWVCLCKWNRSRCAWVETSGSVERRPEAEPAKRFYYA